MPTDTLANTTRPLATIRKWKEKGNRMRSAKRKFLFGGVAHNSAGLCLRPYLCTVTRPPKLWSVDGVFLVCWKFYLNQMEEAERLSEGSLARLAIRFWSSHELYLAGSLSAPVSRESVFKWILEAMVSSTQFIESFSSHFQLSQEPPGS